MASPTDVTKRFMRLNDDVLKKVSFFHKEWRERTVFNTSRKFVRDLQGKIEKAGEEHEPAYQKGYIEPLRKNLKGIIANLNTPSQGSILPDPWRYATLTILVNAALQPAQEDKTDQLHPVQAMVDDLYNSFLESRERLGVKSALDHKISPLVGLIGPLPFFPGPGGKPISAQAPFPCTLELEYLRDDFGLGALVKDFTVGVMGFSLGYVDHPLLWGIIGHEVGGHYVLTADKGDKLLGELQDAIYHKLQSEYPSPALDVLAPLWHYWAEEAAADVCCVLNLGPTTGIGAISFQTAIGFLGNATGQKEGLSGVYRIGEWHPVPCLVPHVICGALDGLNLTKPEIGTAQLNEIAAFYTGERGEVEFEKGAAVPDPHNQGKTILLPSTLPLKTMQDSARLVGHLIATHKLKELKKHNLQALTTWDDQDEGAARDIADKFASGQSASAITMDGGKVQTFQVLAGGILAAMREPDSYDRVSEALSQTFAHL